jgi:hypothetical protein
MKHLKILFLFTVLTTLFQSCDEKNKSKTQKSKEKNYTLLTYGMPDFDRQNSRNVIAEKWGIKFFGVAGCMVTEKLLDSVKTVNKIVNKNIEDKFGKNWEDKFEKEVDAEFENEKKITAILDKVDFIKKKDDQMTLEGNGLHYYMKPIENSKTYNVSVEGWGTIDNKDAWVSYYRMTVNYETKKFVLIDDKIEKRE